jgi:hypothetical protein
MTSPSNPLFGFPNPIVAQISEQLHQVREQAQGTLDLQLVIQAGAIQRMFESFQAEFMEHGMVKIDAPLVPSIQALEAISTALDELGDQVKQKLAQLKG